MNDPLIQQALDLFNAADPEQQTAALRHLRDVLHTQPQDENLTAAVVPLLRHPDPEIRRRSPENRRAAPPGTAVLPEEAAARWD